MTVFMHAGVTALLAMAGSATMPLTTQLKDTLFAASDPEEPPPGDAAVTLGLNIIQIEEVDMLHGVLELHAWVRMAWHDERLRWDDVALFDTVDALHVPAARPAPSSGHAVWVPDIELLNGATSMNGPMRIYDAVLYRNGTVVWSRLVDLRALCAFRGLQNFPEDTPQCRLRFGSAAFDRRLGDLQWASPAVVAQGTLDSEFPGDFLEYNVIVGGVNATRAVERHAFVANATGVPVLTAVLPIQRHVKFYNCTHRSSNPRGGGAACSPALCFGAHDRSREAHLPHDAAHVPLVRRLLCASKGDQSPALLGDAAAGSHHDRYLRGPADTKGDGTHLDGALHVRQHRLLYARLG